MNHWILVEPRTRANTFKLAEVGELIELVRGGNKNNIQYKAFERFCQSKWTAFNGYVFDFYAQKITLIKCDLDCVASRSIQIMSSMDKFVVEHVVVEVEAVEVTVPEVNLHGSGRHDHR